jgi:hypothetical protein
VISGKVYTYNITVDGPSADDNSIADTSESLPESVKVLEECIALQIKKSNDYQNPNSTVVQADYYPSGIKTIHDILHAKMLRAKSVMEAMEHDPNYGQNFESLEDTMKDLINYASFSVSYMRGKISGQNPDRDVFNRKK